MRTRSRWSSIRPVVAGPRAEPSVALGRVEDGAANSTALPVVTRSVTFGQPSLVPSSLFVRVFDWSVDSRAIHSDLMDFSKWTATEWTAFGVVLAAVLTVLGWVGVAIGRRLERIRHAKPQLTFSHATFCRPGEHPRPRAFALYVEVHNHGPGLASPAWLWFIDPKDDAVAGTLSGVKAETSRIPHIPANSFVTDFLGFFRLPDWNDASETEARDLFKRGRLEIHTWDADGRYYRVTPGKTRRPLRKMTDAQFMAALRYGFARPSDSHLAVGVGESSFRPERDVVPYVVGVIVAALIFLALISGK